MRRSAAILIAVALCRCTAPRSGVPERAPYPARPAVGATLPALPAADRVRLGEAFRLAAAVGDRVWPGWGGAPFGVLLVTPESEFLVRHPRPSADFARVGYDSLLGSEVFVRRRAFPPTLLATFPAVGGLPTIVVGQPAAAGQTSTRWVLTLLHEHFHQWQYAQPGYYPGVAALGLARGDTTGMWMLDYAFPYDTAAVQARFAEFTRSLDVALAAGQRDAQAGGRAVAEARARLRAALQAEDDRYLAFQMWQEGVARYTELHVARLAAAPSHVPGPAFRALPDYTAYAAAAAALDSAVRAGLRTAALARERRVAFYAAGAGTALVLDDVAPGWRARYFERSFSLDSLLP